MFLTKTAVRILSLQKNEEVARLFITTILPGMNVHPQKCGTFFIVRWSKCNYETWNEMYNVDFGKTSGTGWSIVHGLLDHNTIA